MICGHIIAHIPILNPASVMRNGSGNCLPLWVIHVSEWIKTAAIAPIPMPIITMIINSQRESRSSAGTINAGCDSIIKRLVAVALTAARITGIKPLMVYSIITTSMAKMTPANGVLNEAAMAPAEPHAIRIRILLLGSRIFCPSKLPPAAPR